MSAHSKARDDRRRKMRIQKRNAEKTEQHRLKDSSGRSPASRMQPSNKT